MREASALVIWFASVTLIVGGVVYWLGAARPLPDYVNCKEQQNVSQSYRLLAERSAADAVRTLYANRADIYGFKNRFAANWYGLRANAIDLLALTGVRLPQPEWTEAHKHYAQAGIHEFALMNSSAIIFGLTPCVTQYMAPQRERDGLSDATTKLESLMLRFDGV